MRDDPEITAADSEIEAGGPNYFQKKADAFGYLVRQGYKISKSKFYQDVQAGELLLDDQERITMNELESYMQRLDEAGRPWGYRRLEREKLELEIRVLRLRERLLRAQYVSLVSELQEGLDAE